MPGSSSRVAANMPRTRWGRAGRPETDLATRNDRALRLRKVGAKEREEPGLRSPSRQVGAKLSQSGLEKLLCVPQPPEEENLMTTRFALVTGSSRGIGRAIALAGQGMHVAVHF